MGTIHNRLGKKPKTAKRIVNSIQKSFWSRYRENKFTFNLCIFTQHPKMCCHGFRSVSLTLLSFPSRHALLLRQLMAVAKMQTGTLSTFFYQQLPISSLMHWCFAQGSHHDYESMVRCSITFISYSSVLIQHNSAAVFGLASHYGNGRHLAFTNDTTLPFKV